MQFLGLTVYVLLSWPVRYLLSASRMSSELSILTFVESRVVNSNESPFPQVAEMGKGLVLWLGWDMVHILSELCQWGNWQLLPLIGYVLGDLPSR